VNCSAELSAACRVLDEPPVPAMPTTPGLDLEGPCPVVSRGVRRLALGLLAVLIASLCSACLATTEGSPDEIPPAVENRAPASEPPESVSRPPSSEPTASPHRPPSSEPTESEKPERKTLPFGKSYTWDDGVTVTVGKPQKFKPSAYTVVDKTKRYLRFAVTVVNKSNKPIDLGLTYISVQSGNKQASEVFDSGTSLRGPPDTKVLKGRASQFEVGFAVTDPKDVVMEVALHEDVERPTVLYST
jgi:hypothetical protein